MDDDVYANDDTFFLDHQQNVLFLKQKESLSHSLYVSILYHVVCVAVDHCFSFLVLSSS